MIWKPGARTRSCRWHHPDAATGSPSPRGALFERLDERLKAQLRAKLEALASDPLASPGVKPMAGEWRGFYRLRHGDLRVIYSFDRPNDRVVVAHIGPRGDVYK